MKTQVVKQVLTDSILFDRLFHFIQEEVKMKYSYIDEISCLYSGYISAVFLLGVKDKGLIKHLGDLFIKLSEENKHLSANELAEEIYSSWIEYLKKNN